MLKSVEGTFRNGRIELEEVPADLSDTKVIVTFLPAEESRRLGRRMTFGMFAGPRMSTEEDFELAEWHGDADLDPDMPDAK